MERSIVQPLAGATVRKPRISRPTSWYRSWMVIDGADAEERDRKREEVAEELRKAVETFHFDSQTLEEIIQILDHELLCLRPEVDNNDLGSYLDLQPRGRSALRTPWIDHLLTTLSECLIRVISDSSHYERELQSRSLICALSILRAQNVQSHQQEHYNLLRSRYEGRFKDLQWQKKFDGKFSREKFRHFQSSYLLCSGAEYAKYFLRAQPTVATAISRTVDVFLLGVSLTLASLGIAGPGRLQLTLEDLDHVLRPLWLNPNEQYQDLFEVQELARILSAFHFYGLIIAEPGTDAQDAASKSSLVLGCSRNLARLTLDRILRLLTERPNFETTVSPPSEYWRHFLAFFNRGPPSFDAYFYLYGLLDCASQLARIVPYGSTSSDLRARMKEITRNSTEPSYRWKAVSLSFLLGSISFISELTSTDKTQYFDQIEFLMCDPLTRNEQSKKVVNDCKQTNAEIAGEVDAICACLTEEDGFAPPQRQSRPLSLAKPQASESTLSVPKLAIMSSSEWEEATLLAATFSFGERHFTIPNKRGCLSAGLAPDCNAAFFLYEERIQMISIRGVSRGGEFNTLLEKAPMRSSYKVAAASNRFLAAVTGKELAVYAYESSPSKYSEVGKVSFESHSNGSPWGPNCVAIHETRDRTWVAVGGQGNENGQICGSIKLYRVDTVAGSFKLTKQSASFARNKPLSKDFLKMLNFSPDGGRLAAVTNNNRILVWFLSNNARPKYAPFEIARDFTTEIKAHGMMSATIFSSPSERPYVLCTTSPSSERWNHNGMEYSFISAVHLSPANVPSQLHCDLSGLGDSEKDILAGAAAPQGNLIALLEETGKIKLFSLGGKDHGGLCSPNPPVKLRKKLAKQKNASVNSLRFRSRNGILYLYALDREGNLIITSVSGG